MLPLTRIRSPSLIRVVPTLEQGPLEGRYGTEPRVEALTGFRDELYRQVELGVRHWMADRRFVPKFLLASGAFVALYGMPGESEPTSTAVPAPIDVDGGDLNFAEAVAMRVTPSVVSIAVEQSGKVYMLAENYPFTRFNLELRRLYRSGEIGRVTYAEGEYNHPIEPEGINALSPGLNHWRNWLPSTYYCTHALAPLIHITDTMPVAVNGLSIAAPEVTDILPRQDGCWSIHAYIGRTWSRTIQARACRPIASAAIPGRLELTAGAPDGYSLTMQLVSAERLPAGDSER